MILIILVAEQRISELNLAPSLDLYYKEQTNIKLNLAPPRLELQQINIKLNLAPPTILVQNESAFTVYTPCHINLYINSSPTYEREKRKENSS